MERGKKPSRQKTNGSASNAKTARPKRAAPKKPTEAKGLENGAKIDSKSKRGMQGVPHITAPDEAIVEMPKGRKKQDQQEGAPKEKNDVSKGRKQNAENVEMPKIPKGRKQKADHVVAPEEEEKPKIQNGHKPKVQHITAPDEEVAKVPKGRKSIVQHIVAPDEETPKAPIPAAKEKVLKRVPKKSAQTDAELPVQIDEPAQVDDKMLAKKAKKKPAPKRAGGKEEEQPTELPKKKAKMVAEPKVSDKIDVKPSSRKRAPTRASTATATKTGQVGEPVNNSADAKSKKARLVNSIDTLYSKEDFDDAKLKEKGVNFKISSWNVAGLRSWIKKDGFKFLEFEDPDIFCLQETKCTNDQLPEEAIRIPSYHPYWFCKPGGYAGVAIYSKIMPINVEYGLDDSELDETGRIITAEYEKFYLINAYVPNSGRKLVNMEERMRWERIFLTHIKRLDARKPVLICGDMNVSHQAIDLANPKQNTRSAGFTIEERNKMTELLDNGFVDTFRHLYPDRTGAYTYWTYLANSRSRNVGWRLDYFIVSQRLINRVVDNCIRSQCKGSDHCPITLFLKF